MVGGHSTEVESLQVISERGVDGERVLWQRVGSHPV